MDEIKVAVIKDNNDIRQDLQQIIESSDDYVFTVSVMVAKRH